MHMPCTAAIDGLGTLHNHSECSENRSDWSSQMLATVNLAGSPSLRLLSPTI